MRHRKRSKAAAQTLGMAIVVIAVLAILLVLTLSRVFVVRDIMVVGNRNLLREEVVTLSGVEIGDNVLGISSAKLRQRLEQNRYIRYLGHGFDYRGTLTLRISERLGMATAYVMGYYYVLDASGLVLECAGEGYPTDVAGPNVTGLSIRQNARITVGERLPVTDETQLEVMERVLTALDETSMLARSSQLSMASMNNLYVMTADSTQIVLGDDSSLRTKLAIAREVLSLRESEGGLAGAKIDVSSGRNAHFIPATLPTVTPVATATPAVTPTPTPEP
ncbi:MAG: cell division protein FtsQ/DivIB [Candidatus Ventricola sp.]